MTWLWIVLFFLVVLPTTSALTRISTRRHPRLRVFWGEFQQFGVVFGLAVFVWTGALTDAHIIGSITVGIIAGLIGGVRGVWLLAEKRRIFGSKLEGWPEELRSELELPSDWQLKSTLKGMAIVATVLGLIVWGISAIA